MAEVNQNVGTTASAPVHRGTTIRMAVSVTDSAGDPLDLTSVVSISYGVFGISPSKDPEAPPLITKSIGSGVSVTNAAGGVFQVTLAPNDTIGLWAGDYYHRAILVDGAGDRYVAMTGTLRLSQRF